MAAGAFAPLAASRRSTTRVVAQGPRRVGRVTAARRTACPTTPARASSPIAPTCSRRRASRSCRRRPPQYVADAKKLVAKNPKKGFSPVYIAGTDWYVAMGFVFDYGGGIATQVSGKWKGLLDSPKSIAGLTAYKNFFLATSRASKTTDETHPNPYDVYAQGQAASMIGPSWFSCCVGAKFKGDDRAVRDARPRQGPGRSRASSAAPTSPSRSTSSNKALAADWIKDFTSTSSEKALQAKGNIPNATNLLGSSVNERAAARSWFVPTAKHWVDVENGNILRNMLAQILTRQAVDQAGSRRRPATTSHRCSTSRNRCTRRSPMATAAETTHDRSRRRRRFWGRTGCRRGAVRADPADRRRDRGDPRLPALLARQALAAAVRTVRADPAPGRLDRARQLPLGPARPGLLAHARCARSSSRR